MTDYFDNTGYDAGAVVDMNNLAIGYFPRAHGNWSAPMSPAPMQTQPFPQQSTSAVPAVNSETTP